MAGRTFDEKEVAEIFRLAAKRQDNALRALSPGGGLTLEELTAIGQEAGISPNFIAGAVQQLSHAPPAAKIDRLAGFPVGFTRTIDVPASFGEEHWNRLVSSLHDELDVLGRTHTAGNTRIWESEIGQMVAEPREEGYRLRLKLSKDTFRGALIMGGVMTVMGIFFMLVLASKGDFLVDMAKTLVVSMFAIAGLAGLGYGAVKFPNWVADKEARIDHVLENLLAGVDAASLETVPPTTEAEVTQASTTRLSLDPEQAPLTDTQQTTHHKTRS
ncbi:MAG: hypothetical protein AAF564_02090 [Bacteroidota bacterium]